MAYFSQKYSRLTSLHENAMIRTVLTTILALAAAVFTSNAAAQRKPELDFAKQPEKAVMIVTFITEVANGGSVGASFQEFSSRSQCETAVMVLNDQAKKHAFANREPLNRPIAQCVQQ